MIKAIETSYAGCRFRSRLEARWAVFLDTLGYQWEYEPEGFHLPHGDYLPDFWLPGQNKWVEIKGPTPSHQDFQRFNDFGPLQWKQGNRFVILVGDIPRPYPEPSGIPQITYSELPVPAEDPPNLESVRERAKLPQGTQFLGCSYPGEPSCGFLFDERVVDSCGCSEFPGFILSTWLPQGDFIQALYTARSVRFEHGETGTR